MKKNIKNIIIFVTLFSMLIFAYTFMQIRQIDCYSQYGPCPDSLNNQFSDLVGQPIFKPIPKTKVKYDLSVFPQVKTISYYRRLPSTLVVAVSLRKPIGALGPNVLGSQAIADEEGFVFQNISQSSLPTLITKDKPAISSYLSKNQLQSLVYLGMIGDLFDTQLSGTLEGNVLTVSTPNGQNIIIDIAQPASNWYTPLQLIIHRSKINAKMPHKIDLRFNNSVITY